MININYEIDKFNLPIIGVTFPLIILTFDTSFIIDDDVEEYVDVNSTTGFDFGISKPASFLKQSIDQNLS